jgi:hypothetical protein
MRGYGVAPSCRLGGFPPELSEQIRCPVNDFAAFDFCIGLRHECAQFVECVPLLEQS